MTRVPTLVRDRAVGAAAHGEVVAADDDAAPVDRRRSDDVVRRGDRDELAVLVDGLPVSAPVSWNVFASTRRASRSRS
jgi:hypothetical protein